jgi:Flp pilus assembly protein TadB
MSDWKEKAKDYKAKLKDIVALLEKERTDNVKIMESMQQEIETTRRQLKRRKHHQQAGGEELIKMKEIYVSCVFDCFARVFLV